jgi:hypothetical protein
MNRFFSRLLIALILIGGSWLAYQASDFYNCNGPKAKEWFNKSTTRLEEAVSDQDSSKKFMDLFTHPESVNPAISDELGLIRKKLYIDDLTNLSSKAENRYKAQQSQETPECLSEVQNNLIDTFYYNWKYYDSALTGEISLANNYANKFMDSLDNLIVEFDKLKAKYAS